MVNLTHIAVPKAETGTNTGINRRDVDEITAGRGRIRGHSVLLASMGLLFFLAGLGLFPQKAQATGQDLFAQQCTACHALSAEAMVGPGLAGVVEERDRDWLLRKITEPDQLSTEGDPITAALIEEYGSTMPPLAISDEDATAIIDFLAEVPADATVDSPSVEATYTPEQIDRGRSLFQGTERFENRAVSCNACHTVNHPDVFGGGSLAADLTESYSRTGASGLEAMLGNAPFPVMNAAYADRPLTETEIEELTAFLQHTASDPQEQATNYGLTFFGSGAIGTLILIGFLSVLWRGRRRESVNQSIYDRQIKSR